MIGAIGSATIGTFKWGVSLIAPLVVTEWAINKFEGLGALHGSFPPARNGLVGLFSFALLRRLTGCGLKTALVASSVIPILNEIGRRIGPSLRGGLCSDDVLGNFFNLFISINRPGNESREVNTRKLVSQVGVHNLIDQVLHLGTHTTLRFRELSEQDKKQVWLNIFDSMQQYVRNHSSHKLPFPGFAGETLFLNAPNESLLTLDVKEGQHASWTLGVTKYAFGDKIALHQRYIEFLIAKHRFFDHYRFGFTYAFGSLIEFCIHYPIILSPPPFTMFNDVLATHDLTFAVRTGWNTGQHTTKTVAFTKQSSRDPRNSLTLTIEWTQPTASRWSDRWAESVYGNYEVSIQRGDPSEKQTYTFRQQRSGWDVTHDQTTYPLETICKHLNQESDWDLELNSDDMRDISEMIQMSDELLHSPHTVVFHQGSTIPYLTSGKPIPYEKLKQIATFTNEAEGQSVLRVDGNRVLWENEVVDEYFVDEEASGSEGFKRNNTNSRQFGGINTFNSNTYTRESSEVNARVFRTHEIDRRKKLVGADALESLINNITDSRNNPTIRFCELSEDSKEQVWSTIFISMQGYVAYNTSKKLPFVGYAGETLTLVKTNEGQLQLEAKKGQTTLWRIELDTSATRSESARTQRYIELLIAKHRFFDIQRAYFITAFDRVIEFRNRVLDPYSTPPSFSMFNTVLAPHDLKFSVHIKHDSGDDWTNKTVTFTKKSSSNLGNNLTLTINRLLLEHVYEVSIQRDARSESQKYTFQLQGFSWHVIHDQDSYDLGTILNRLEPESDWDLELNEDDMRDVFEMIQMNDELLHSPHTVVFHKDSTIPYLTNGTPIPYKRLKQIATFTNGAEGPSVLRVDGNRVLWENEVVEEYSEPVESSHADDSSWSYSGTPSEGENDDASDVSHSHESGSNFDSSECSSE